MSLFACSKVPVIEKFTGRNNLPKGEELELKWQVKHAQNVWLTDSITGKKEEVKHHSSKKLKPNSNFTYIITAQNGNIIKEDKFSGKIIKNFPAIEFFGGTEKYRIGDEKPVTLYWKIRGSVKEVYINGAAWDLPAQGQVALQPEKNITYKLVAVGIAGDTSFAYHKVEVLPLIYTIEINNEINGKQLIANHNNKIKWAFPNAKSVEVVGFGKNMPNIGEIVAIVPIDSIKYNIKIIVNYGNNQKYQFNNICEVIPLKLIFKSSPYFPEYIGQEITLKWQTYGASKVKIFTLDENIFQQNGGGVGSKKIIYQKPIRITLHAYDTKGKVYEQQLWIKNQKTRPFITGTVNFQDLKKDMNPQKEGKKPSFISDIYQVDRSKFPEQITIKVLVTDSSGSFVRGLAPPQISTEESKSFFSAIIETAEGKVHNIKDFSIKEINDQVTKPLDIALSLDYSGSMAGYINGVEKSVLNFFNIKDKDDKISVVKFDHRLVTEKKLTTSSDSLSNHIAWEGLKNFGGGTALYAGADEALEALDTLSKNQKIMYVLTDGRENSSVQHAKKRAFTLKSLAKKARRKGVKIYPIGLGIGVDEKLLTDMAWLTDGKAYFVYDNKSVDSVYAEIPKIFKNYYEIVYKPTNQSHGYKELSLRYFNGKTVVGTGTQYQTNDDFDIDEKKGFIKKSTTIDTTKKQPKIVIPPQAVAFFGFDKDNLEPKFTGAMESIFDFLIKNPKYQANIVGHTDLVGTETKNEDLSRRRAETIANYLIKKGIDKKRLTIKAMGKTEPIWIEEKEEWQAQENRRIEIEVWE